MPVIRIAGPDGLVPSTRQGQGRNVLEHCLGTVPRWWPAPADPGSARV